MTKSARKSFSCSALTSAVNVPAANAAPDDLAILRGDFVERLLFSCKGGPKSSASIWYFQVHGVEIGDADLVAIGLELGDCCIEEAFREEFSFPGCGEHDEEDFCLVFTFPFRELFFCLNCLLDVVQCLYILMCGLRMADV